MLNNCPGETDHVRHPILPSHYDSVARPLGRRYSSRIVNRSVRLSPTGTLCLLLRVLICLHLCHWMRTCGPPEGAGSCGRILLADRRPIQLGWISAEPIANSGSRLAGCLLVGRLRLFEQ